MTLEAALAWSDLVAAGVRARPEDADDVRQEANIAAWRALERYDKKRNDEFRGYAHRGVRGAALRVVVRRASESLPASLSVAATIERELAAKPTVVRAALSRLPERQREILLLSVVEGYTEAEIAARFHLSARWIHTLRRAALCKMRELLSHHASREGLL